MNTMYDMTHYVVSIATEFITASHLARLFMEGVLPKFDSCALIVVDVDNKFKGIFVAMTGILGLMLQQ